MCRYSPRRTATSVSGQRTRGSQNRARQALAFYRLDRVKESVKAVGFDSERIETAIKYNMEIR